MHVHVYVYIGEGMSNVDLCVQVWSCALKEVDANLDIRQVWVNGDPEPYHLARWPNRDDIDPSVVSKF